MLDPTCDLVVAVTDALSDLLRTLELRVR
jgi:hypothetical protein